MPVVKAGVPPADLVEIIILPPELVPAEVPEDAFKTIAELDVLDDEISSEIVKSPDTVETFIAPVAVIPIGFTTPTVRALLSTYVSDVSDSPAIVPTLLLVESRRTAPPIKANLSATM